MTKTLPSRCSSLRLKDFDYSRPGWYFVTVCVQNRLPLFGDIHSHAFHPNDAGVMITNMWLELPQRFSWVDLDAFTVMPNHFHGIIVFRPENPEKKTLGDVVGAWKSITTVEYIKGVKTEGWTRFRGTLWQVGYHDHIIRDPKELERLQSYIYYNPAQWEIDALHPDNPSPW